MMIGFALSQGSVSFVPIENTQSGDSYSILDDGASITFTGTGGQFLGVSVSVPKAAIAAEPVPYGAPVLTGDGTPEPGETLTVQPVPLWFFDAAQGMPAIDYVASGANAVVGQSLLLDASDASTDVTVTERASYDGASYGTAQSNAVSVGGVAAPPPEVPGAFGAGDFALADNANGSIGLGISALPDDGGLAIKDVEYTTDGAATWRAVPGYAGLGSYTLGFASDGAALQPGSYDVQLRAINAVGAGAASALQSVSVTSGAPGELTVTELEGQIQIDTSAPGDVTITVTGNPHYNGSYVISRTDLTTGPVNLVPAAIAYTDGSETELTHVPGLWATDESALTLEINWQSNGVDITNANTPNLILSGADAGTTLTLRETATDANGSRSAISNGIAVAGGGLVFETTFSTAHDPLSASADWESAELVSDRVISDGSVARPGLATAQENVLASIALPQAQFTEWRFASVGAITSAQYRHVLRSTRAGRYLFVRHMGGMLNDFQIQVAGGGSFRIGAIINRAVVIGALYRAEVTEAGEVTLLEDGVPFFTTTLSAADNHSGDGAGMDFRPTGQEQNHTISYFRAGELV